MNPKFQTKKFKDLKTKWYSKLEKSGFKDIEKGESFLRTRSIPYMFSAYYNEVTHEATELYYIKAGQFLHEYEFPTQLERLVWTYHSKGISISNIRELLKKKNIKAYRKKIYLIITDLAKKMLTND